MYEKIPSLINKSETISHIGKIENVVGMSMEASGGRSSIGDIVMIYNEEQNRQMPAPLYGQQPLYQSSEPSADPGTPGVWRESD